MYVFKTEYIFTLLLLRPRNVPYPDRAVILPRLEVSLDFVLHSFPSNLLWVSVHRFGMRVSTADGDLNLRIKRSLRLFWISHLAVPGIKPGTAG